MENSQDIGVTHQYATSAPQNVPQGCNLAQTIRIVGKDNRGRFGKMSALRCVSMPSFSCFVSDRQHKQQSEKTQSQLIRCVRKPRLCTICAAIAILRMADASGYPVSKSGAKALPLCTSPVQLHYCLLREQGRGEISAALLENLCVFNVQNVHISITTGFFKRK